MVEIEAKSASGTVVTIGVPMDGDDILFGPYLDFLATREQYYAADEKTKEAIAVSYLAQALSHVFTGDLHKVPFTLPGDFDKRGMPSVFTGISLVRLEDHLLRVVKAAKERERPLKGGKYEFTYKGETWHIGTDRAITYLTGIAFTAGEVIEAHETDRLMNLLIEKKGDAQKNYAYERDLSVVGILAKKEGFRMPWEINERMAYVQRQMRYFKDLPLGVVLDIRFFLRIILKELEESQDIIGFLTTQNPLVPKALAILRLRSQISELKQMRSAGRHS